MKKILFKKRAEKELKKLDKNLQEKVIKKIVYIANYPYSGKFLQGEFKGNYSLRVWPYRIIYEIGKDNIVILRVSHHQGAYKN